MASKRNLSYKPRLSDERMAEIFEAAWKRYEGDVTVIESAFGALLIGRYLGWHALRLLHPRAFKTYEQVLGVRFRDVLPDRGPDVECLAGMRTLDEIGRFWQVVSSGLVPASEVCMKTVSRGGIAS
jgi:hypothetical protein